MANVAPTKSLKFKIKQRRLLLPEDSPTEGKGNGTKVFEEPEKAEPSVKHEKIAEESKPDIAQEISGQAEEARGAD